MENDREISEILNQPTRVTEAADDLQLQQRLRAFFEKAYERRLPSPANRVRS